MVMFSWILVAFAATTVAAGDWEEKTRVQGTMNHFDQHDLNGAMQCLDTWCKNNIIQGGGKVRCRQGQTVVYVCNYGSHLSCNLPELRGYHEKLMERVPGTKTGWLFFPYSKKTLGYDRWCPNAECYGGFKEGHRGELCTNTAIDWWQVDLKAVDGEITERHYRVKDPKPNGKY